MHESTAEFPIKNTCARWLGEHRVVLLFAFLMIGVLPARALNPSRRNEFQVLRNLPVDSHEALLLKRKMD